MAEVKKTGTATPLSSLFTSEDAEKAARVVDDAIAERHKELHRVSDFIADNSTLIHHVQKLPDELSHDIMVPFGASAFFPGRLIHTNEFTVLLGEGYYAERSAKQTVEILQRRGKSLEAHLESLKRIIKDLDAEAKFFESTAAEVAEGLVEIREEYVEEVQSKKPEKGIYSTNLASSSKVRNSVVPDDESEDAKIMARLDELEKEEEEAASDLGQDEDCETTSSSHIDEDEDEEDEEDEDDENEDEEDVNEDEDDDVNDNAEDVSDTDDEAQAPVSRATDPGIFFPTYLQKDTRGLLHHSSHQSSVSGSIVQASPGGSSESIVVQPYANPPSRLETKEYPPKSANPNIRNSSERMSSQISNTSSESKAFTGTVIEHSHYLGPTNVSASIQPSRPVSRFKMLRGNR